MDPVYGIQLHHHPPVPLVHRGSGIGSLAEQVTSLLDREDAVVAALRLQRDAGLMTSNLQVLGQFATSLNRMSCEVLRLAIGPDIFPSTAVNSLSPLPRARH